MHAIFVFIYTTPVKKKKKGLVNVFFVQTKQIWGVPVKKERNKEKLINDIIRNEEKDTENNRMKLR